MKARACLKIVGFSPVRGRAFDVQEARQPAASAPDRRHHGAPVQRRHEEGLRSQCEEVRSLPRPVTGIAATSEDLRRYQLHTAQRQASPGTINAAIAALRFFFTVTLEKPDLVRPLRTVTKPRTVPVVLS